MSRDSSKNASQAYLAKLAVQTQLARLRREEDEDLWISGEELYTEGSSDEEDSRSKSRHHRLRNHLRPGSSSERRNDMIPTNSNANSTRLTEQFSTEVKAKSDGSDMASGCKLGDKLKEETSTVQLLDSTCKFFSKESDHLGMPLESHNVNLSSNENSTLNLESDEDDEGEPDIEISWKPRRVEGRRSLILEEAIAALKELQLDYNNVSDSVLKLCECLSSRENEPRKILSIETLINGNPDGLFPKRECESRNTKYLDDCNADRSVEKKETNIMRMHELDASINKLEKEIEEVAADTLHCQRQNRKELQELLLLRSPETGRLLKNTKAFLQLCPEIKTATSEVASNAITSEISTMMNNIEMHDSTFVNLTTEKQQLKKKLSMLEKKHVMFAERNKRLAACSMGSLAITDEEKQRLENLVTTELDDTKNNSGSMICDTKSQINANPYSLDTDAIRQLKELDEKLARINSHVFKHSQNMKYGKHERLEHRLDCINYSLQVLAESKSKEILPVSENGIQKLIEEYHAECNNKDPTLQHLAEVIVSPTGNVETKSNESTIPSYSSASTIDTVEDISQDIIDELIKEAQISMPLFQSRYEPNIAGKY